MITFRQINPWAVQEQPSMLDLVGFSDHCLPCYSQQAVWLGDSGDVLPCYADLNGPKEFIAGPYMP